MVLSLSLSPDVEARLRDRARASGLSPEECARRIVEEAVNEAPAGSTTNGASRENGAPRPQADQATSASAKPPRDTLPPEEIARRREAIRSLAGSVRGGAEVDDSRESIYGGEQDRGT
jgi:hypothetical protein